MREIPAFPSLEESHPRQAGAYRSGHSPSSPARLAGLLPAAGMEAPYRQDGLQLCLSQLPCCLRLERKANSQEQTLGAVGGLWRSLPSGQKDSLWGWQTGAPQQAQPQGVTPHGEQRVGWSCPQPSRALFSTRKKGLLDFQNSMSPLHRTPICSTHPRAQALAHHEAVAGACLL